MGMKERKKLFVLAYDGDAESAALSAGYSKTTAKIQGARLLQDPEVIQGIRDRAKLRADVQAQPSKLAKMRNMSKALLQLEADILARFVGKPIADRDERQRFWSSVMRNPLVPTAQRLAASELLGRAHGDFLDRVQFDGAMVVLDGSPIMVVTPLSDSKADEILDVDASPLMLPESEGL